MATFKNNAFLPNFTGRIGDYVVYQLNGKQVVRSIPKSKVKTQPSPLQKVNQNAFAAQVKFAKHILGTIIRPIWGQVANTEGLTYYNRFLKANKMAFNNTEKIMFPELLTLSIGNLAIAPDFKVNLENSILHFSWSTECTHYLVSNTDLLKVLWLKNHVSIDIIDIQAQRGDGSLSISLPNEAGAELEGYVYWSSADHKIYSPSMYWRVNN